MRKMRRWTILMAMIWMVSMLPLQVFAAEIAELPRFKVTLNGKEYHSLNSRYPLFVYKGITYLPATYFTMRYMGIATEFQNGTLYLSKPNISGSFDDYPMRQSNPKKIAVSRAKANLIVLGNEVRSSQYPIMSFRNVMYLPMTWELMHDQLGMNYVFSESRGLIIQSDDKKISESSSMVAGDNPVDEHLNPIDLELYPVSDGKRIYRYAQDKIISTNMQGKDVKEIYRFGDNPLSPPHIGDFQVENGNFTVRYRVGTAVMGHNTKIEVDEQGKLREKHLGNGIYKIGKEAEYYYAFPGTQRGDIREMIGERGKNIGDETYFYGYGKNIDIRDNYRQDSFGEYKDKIYLMAQKDKGMNIVSIDKKTKKTEMVVDLDVLGFVMDQYLIYFWTKEGIYFYNIDHVDTTDTLKLSPGNYKLYCRIDKVEQVFPNKTMTPYFIREGILMQTAGSEGGTKLNGDAKVIRCRYDGTKEQYFVCTFQDSRSGNRILIRNEFGDEMISSDPAVSVSIIGDEAYYYNLKTRKITKMDLSSLR